MNLFAVETLVLFLIFFFGLRKNVKRVPDGQCIIAANHNSSLDTYVLASLLSRQQKRKTRVVAAKDTFARGLGGWFARWTLNVELLERNPRGAHDPLAGAKQILKDGWSLIVYPEGTRGEPEVAAMSGLIPSRGIRWLLLVFACLSAISMFLLAVWLVWSDKLARGEKIPLWIFFALMILWSNLHGEFIAGILILLAYTVGWTMEFLFNRINTDLETGRRLWTVFLGTGVASLLNPATYHPYVTILGFMNNPYLMSRMSEANSPD